MKIKRIVVVSDLTEKEIPEDELASVRITLASRPSDVLSLDVAESEIFNLIEAAIIRAKPGRKA